MQLNILNDKVNVAIGNYISGVNDIDKFMADIVRYAVTKRCLKGKEVRAYQGFFVNGQAPYGYVFDHCHRMLIPDNNAASTVKWIYERFIEGCGYTAIAKELTEKGIVTPSIYKSSYLKGRNNAWSSLTIKNILTNPIYVGQLEINKTQTLYEGAKLIKRRNFSGDIVRVMGKHQPIITEDVFDRAQTRVRYIYSRNYIETRRYIAPLNKSLGGNL